MCGKTKEGSYVFGRKEGMIQSKKSGNFKNIYYKNRVWFNLIYRRYKSRVIDEDETKDIYILIRISTVRS